MARDPETGRGTDAVVPLFLFALFVLLSPFTQMWAADTSPWYLPYILWLVLVGLIARAGRAP
jgi:fatty acid desaturase